MAFAKLLINPNYGRDITCHDFMIQNNFTQESYTFIDNACRLTDGGGADRYVLFELLQAVNQHFSADIMQPTMPTDIGLFAEWRKNLLKLNNVTILLNHEVKKIYNTQIPQNKSHIDYLELKDVSLASHIPSNKKLKVKAKKYIFAIPPDNMLPLLKTNATLANSFGDFSYLKKWHQNTKYITYIPVTFHWDYEIKLPKIWGFPKTDWGIAWIVLNDYMTFKNPKSKTVITACVSKVDQVSRRINKTPHQCSEGELIDEIFEQVKEAFPNLPDPTASILSPGVYKNNDGLWETKDDAYILGTMGYQRDMKSPSIDNLYWVGCHSGNQNYHFTAIESAISNGVALANQLIPETKKEFQIGEILSVRQIFWGIVFLIFIFWFFVIRN